MSSSIWDLLPSSIQHPVLDADPFWSQYQYQSPKPSLHLSILNKNYLELILDKKKTIESRFSLYRRVPFERVNIGDVLLLKQTGGPIKGVAYVSRVWFYRLNENVLMDIRNQFGKRMQIQDEAFWMQCATRSYASLLELDHIVTVAPIKYSKKDRNAWAVYSNIEATV